MSERIGKAVWKGGLKTGNGRVSTASGTLDLPKETCPVSKALAGTEITLTAVLKSEGVQEKLTV